MRKCTLRRGGAVASRSVAPGRIALHAQSSLTVFFCFCIANRTASPTPRATTAAAVPAS